ncbi:SusC/RagA family TonB-linked outer membrane protein [Olivibacter jilunii]|uniref:SusC/RagA family TonB-linked outer membrane protein n=1 Tax=Olivibacter jilunii TaxID=985016 RepID=UPI0013EF0731|nr:SusC/RagA family TonB-linked outer membrane protein [Olivibacter jilunii]
MKEIFRQIKKQTGLTVMYSNDIVSLDLAEKLNVNFKNTPIEDVLNFILSKKNLTYSFVADGVLILKPKGNEKKSTSLNSSQDTTANTFAINGKVTDASGNPIPGVTILVKGTRLGSTSDSNGTFSIPSVTQGLILQASSIGYQTRELKITGNTVLILLPIDMKSLDETVVIGYGTSTRRFNTGNIGSVKAKEIEKQPVTNPLLALQGRVPGLFVEQTTGLPGTGVKVRIQGQNSIGNGNDPLYVIDGVPFSSQLLPSINPSLLGNSGTNDLAGNPFNFINPSNIESIEVLKDADATAIYGSRAANGAILITTKKGQQGKTKISLNMQNGWGQNARRIKLLNSQEYLEMRREANKNDGLTSPRPNDYDLNGFWDTTRYTDWQKELIGGTANYSDIQVSASGGSENTQFIIGAGYHRETTVFPGNFSDQKGSVHFNINNISSNKKLRIQFTGNYLNDRNLLPNVDLTSDAIRLAPIAPPVYNTNGEFNWMPTDAGTSSFIANPLRYTLTRYKNLTDNLIGNAIVGYKILDNLEIKSSFGYTKLSTSEISTTPLTYYPPENRAFNVRSAGFGNNKQSSWIIEPMVNFHKSSKMGTLEILLGSTLQHSSTNGTLISGFGQNSDLNLEDIKAATQLFVSNSLNTEYKYNAIFGRINYNLDEKYIINLTARRDGSSRFGSSNRFHNFGAIGAAWIFSQEKLVKDNLHFLSFGKLRGSYGTSGSDQIGDYRFMSLYENFNVAIPYQGIQVLTPIRLANPYLRWEETKKLQIGIELGIINDKVHFVTNYFNNKSLNQLMGYQLPWTTGFSNIDQNFPAVVKNKGWEFLISSNNITSKNFTWTSNINFTKYSNAITSFPGLDVSSYATTYEIGKPINISRRFKFMGVDPSTGLYQFLTHDNKLTSTPDEILDRTAIISLDPSFFGGIQNTFAFKNIYLDILFQFVKQRAQNYRFGPIRQGHFSNGNGNQPIEVLDRWQKPGDIAQYQQFRPNSSDVRNAYSDAVSSDIAYSDASYIRLKNISLSWELPNRWKEAIHFQSLNIFLQSQNLFTITNYVGLDPESKSSSSLPPLRVITIGIKATL